VDPQPPLGEGPLSGVAFGVKDIFDTAGVPTEWGSPLMAGRIPEVDCPLVRMLRERGGIMVGKTHTTSFAYFDAAPTRNPHDLECTPGGSSSGSAAAVAAGMVPFAIGSQTQGSVLRPASFCGCVGFKPTLGLLPIAGAMPFSPELDTAGLFTPTASAMSALWGKMGLAAEASPAGPMAAFAPVAEVEAPMREAFSRAVERLGAHWIDPPDSFRELAAVVRLIQEVEGGRTHCEIWRRHGTAMGVKLAGLIERGLSTPEETFQAALSQLRQARRDMEAVFRQYPVVLTAAALGAAPRDLSFTGDPRMNAPWTGIGSPAISVPMPVGGALPLGLQIAAAPGQDAALLATAVAVENEWS